MGQSLPLPEKIPYPSEEIKTSMEKDGILLGEKDDYVTYVLPNGWKMKNLSYRANIPDFHIVDENRMSRYHIYGLWGGGNYDNDLKIKKVYFPFPKKNKKENN